MTTKRRLVSLPNDSGSRASVLSLARQIASWTRRRHTRRNRRRSHRWSWDFLKVN